jgi:hypothetical protein
MKEIDELRDIWRLLPAPSHSEELLLADMDRCITSIECEIAEKYMLLPCAADGRSIHIGDYIRTKNSNPTEVVGVGQNRFHGPMVQTEDPIKGGWFCVVPDTLVVDEPVSDLLYDFLIGYQEIIKESINGGSAEGAVEKQRLLVSEYAARFRDLFCQNADKQPLQSDSVSDGVYAVCDEQTR